MRLIVVALAAAVLSGFLGIPLRKAMRVEDKLPLPPNVEFFEKWSSGLAQPAGMAYWLKFLSTVGGWITEKGTKGSVALGNIYAPPERSAWMELYLRGIVQLAPKFPEPYLYAGVIFYWFANDAETAIEFLELGDKENVNRWEVPFYLGFYHFRLGNLDKAQRYLEKASWAPNATYIVPLTMTLVASRRGEPETGVKLLETLLEHLPESMQQFQHLIEADLKIQKALLTLNLATREFAKSNGRPPKSKDELEVTGFLYPGEVTLPAEILNFDGTTFSLK